MLFALVLKLPQRKTDTHNNLLVCSMPFQAVTFKIFLLFLVIQFTWQNFKETVEMFFKCAIKYVETKSDWCSALKADVICS